MRQRILYLAEASRLGWMIDQDTWHVGGLKYLDDDALVALLDKIELRFDGDSGARASGFKPVLQRR